MGLPDQHHAAGAEMAGGNEAILKVVEAVVLDGHRPACEHLSRVREVEPTSDEGLGRFARLKLMSTGVNVTPFKLDGQQYL